MSCAANGHKTMKAAVAGDSSGNGHHFGLLDLEFGSCWKIDRWWSVYIKFNPTHVCSWLRTQSRLDALNPIDNCIHALLQAQNGKRYLFIDFGQRLTAWEATAAGPSAATMSTTLQSMCTSNVWARNKGLLVRNKIALTINIILLLLVCCREEDGLFDELPGANRGGVSSASPRALIISSPFPFWRVKGAGSLKEHQCG